MKFRCPRQIKDAVGHQEFEVEAENEEEARKLFAKGEGVLVYEECEVTDLDEYDLDSIWDD